MKRGLALALTCLNFAACERSDLGGYDFTEQQAQAIRVLLSGEEGRHLVTTADNQSAMLEDQQQEQPGYEPYFATGDFDDDGIQDFVVAVQDGDSYDAYLIRGAKDGYHPASWFVEIGWLPEAGMFVKGHSLGPADMIGIGSFFSDDAFWFGWDEETNQLQPLPSEMEE